MKTKIFIFCLCLLAIPSFSQAETFDCGSNEVNISNLLNNQEDVENNSVFACIGQKMIDNCSLASGVLDPIKEGDGDINYSVKGGVLAECKIGIVQEGEDKVYSINIGTEMDEAEKGGYSPQEKPGAFAATIFVKMAMGAFNEIIGQNDNLSNKNNNVDGIIKDNRIKIKDLLTDEFIEEIKNELGCEKYEIGYYCREEGEYYRSEQNCVLYLGEADTDFTIGERYINLHISKFSKAGDDKALDVTAYNYGEEESKNEARSDFDFYVNSIKKSSRDETDTINIEDWDDYRKFNFGGDNEIITLLNSWQLMFSYPEELEDSNFLNILEKIRKKIINYENNQKTEGGKSSTVQQKELIRNTEMYNRLKGKIVLKVEDEGKAYYINPENKMAYYLGRPDDAFNVMRDQGIGITNKDLEKIEIGSSSLTGVDTDGDGLSDMFEDAIGTDKNNRDTDGDGYRDGEEIKNGFSPKGAGRANINNDFANKQKGKILLQVEGNGEAWYINPQDGKRYFLGRPSDAFNVMRNLGLGISNSDFDSLGKE